MKEIMLAVVLTALSVAAMTNVTTRGQGQDVISETNVISNTFEYDWSMTMTNALSARAELSTIVRFGPVQVCTTNGAVVIDDGVTMDAASREFWKRLSEMYMACFPRAYAGQP